MVLAAALWATVGVADAAMSGPDLSPAVAGFVRTALGALVLCLAAAALRLPFRASTCPRPQFPWLAALAFGLCCALFQVSLFAAFHHVGVSMTVTVTVCLPPLLLALGEAIMRARMPDPRLTGAVALAMAGVLALKVPGSGGLPAATDLRGIVLLLVASLAFCGLTLASRHMARRVPGLWAASAGLAVTAVLLFAVTLITAPSGFGTLHDLGVADVLLLAYIGVTATGVASLAFACGLARAASTSAALVATMSEPVFAALLAALVIGERLTPLQVAGIAILIVAMIVLAGVRPTRDSQPLLSGPASVDHRA